SVNDIVLREADFRFHIDSTGQNNLAFLIDYFRPDQPNPNRRINFSLNQAKLENLSFTYKNEATNEPVPQEESLNYNHFRIKNLSAQLTELDIKREDWGGIISGLQLKELGSGLEIRDLSAAFMINPQSIVLDDFRLELNRSLITDYLALNFEEWSDFRD